MLRSSGMLLIVRVALAEVFLLLFELRTMVERAQFIRGGKTWQRNKLPVSFIISKRIYLTIRSMCFLLD